MTLSETLRSAPLKKWWPWIWSAFPVIVLLELQAVAPVGHWWILWLEMPYLFGVLVSAHGVVWLPFLLFRRATRVKYLALWIASAIYSSLAVAGFLVGKQTRTWGFDRLAARSAPLVTAIRAYSETHGRPPATLSELVPAHLPRVPKTGIMAYPKYEYHAGTNAAWYEGNPWVLVVRTPGVGINFDQFMYFPMLNYPSNGYGGSLERIRDWAYVHE